MACRRVKGRLLHSSSCQFSAACVRACVWAPPGVSTTGRLLCCFGCCAHLCCAPAHLLGHICSLVEETWWFVSEVSTDWADWADLPSEFAARDSGMRGWSEAAGMWPGPLCVCVGVAWVLVTVSDLSSFLMYHAGALLLAGPAIVQAGSCGSVGGVAWFTVHSWSASAAIATAVLGWRVVP